MRSVLVSALAIVAASFAAPIDAPVKELAVRYSSNGSSSFVFSPVIGGLGGTDFAGPSYSDIAALAKQPELPKITGFCIRGDKRVDQISYDIAFANGSVGHYTYGGNGGKPISLQLKDGELITEVRIQLGGAIHRRNSPSQSPEYPGEISGIPSTESVQPEEIPGVLQTHPSPEADPPSPFPEAETLPPSNVDTLSATEADSPPPSPNPDLFTAKMKGLKNGYRESEGRFYARLTALDNKITVQKFQLIKGTAVSLSLLATTGVLGGLLIDHYIRKPRSLRLHYMAIVTNFGNMIEQGTQGDHSSIVFQPPPGCTELVGFVGSSGEEVDAIGPVWG